MRVLQEPCDDEDAENTNTHSLLIVVVIGWVIFGDVEIVRVVCVVFIGLQLSPPMGGQVDLLLIAVVVMVAFEAAAAGVHGNLHFSVVELLLVLRIHFGAVKDKVTIETPMQSLLLKSFHGSSKRGGVNGHDNA